MNKAPMPAAPPTAQPRADATSSVHAETSKGMRMAQEIATVSGNTLVSKFFNPMSAERQAEREVRRRKGAAGREKAATGGNCQGTRSSSEAPILFAPKDLDNRLRELQDR
jgi:hypothetical protein